MFLGFLFSTVRSLLSWSIVDCKSGVEVLNATILASKINVFTGSLNTFIMGAKRAKNLPMP